jgi:hypothetical protein
MTWPGNTNLSQVLAERSLSTTIQVQRATFASDGRGGQIKTTQVVATIAGLIRPLGSNAQEQAIADSLTGRSAWVVEVPLGTAIDAATDRLLESGSGRAFEVIQTLPATDNVTLPIVCVEVT